MGRLKGKKNVLKRVIFEEKGRFSDRVLRSKMKHTSYDDEGNDGERCDGENETSLKRPYNNKRKNEGETLHYGNKKRKSKECESNDVLDEKHGLSQNGTEDDKEPSIIKDNSEMLEETEMSEYEMRESSSIILEEPIIASENCDVKRNRYQEACSRSSYLGDVYNWLKNNSNDEPLNTCPVKHQDEEELSLSDLDRILDDDSSLENTEEVKNERKENDSDDYFTVNTKLTMHDYCHDHFDVMPDGWLKIVHRSSVKMYACITTRVVTMSKPYYLGSGSIRSHRIPRVAIPCLQYKMTKEKLSSALTQKRVICGLPFPITRVISVREYELEQTLSPQETRDYAKKVMTLGPMRPRPIRDKPGLPKNMKIVVFPLVPLTKEGRPYNFREYTLNPNDRSFIAVLHEYLLKAANARPDFREEAFFEKGALTTYFRVSILLNGEEVASGNAASKRDAKLMACKNALEKLIPGFHQITAKAHNKKSEPTTTFILDELEITDSRVPIYCVKASEPVPYTILNFCMRKSYTVNFRKANLNEYTMALQDQTVTVLCKNKQEGKQKAAQAMIQKLHPKLKLWGEISRQYKFTDHKYGKWKRLEQNKITTLQAEAKMDESSEAVLEKLFEELEKLPDLENHEKKMRASRLVAPTFQENDNTPIKNVEDC